MATLVTRSGKGSPLTHAEVDANFTNLNTDKLELSGGTMTGNLSFGDNDKAIFGAGSDLEIYHDGTRSYIDENGTGDLWFRAENMFLRNMSNKNYLKGTSNAQVELFHNGLTKLATTSTGVDITGTLTTDQLTVYNGTSDPDVLFRNNGTGDVTLTFRRGAADDVYTDWSLINDNGTFTFRSDNSSDPDHTQLTMSQGDISFYEDTGTTAKFFWDASTERLGIGNTTPVTALDVTGTVTADGLTVDGDAKFTDISPAIILSESDTTNVNTRLGNYGGDFSITTVNDSDVYVANRLTVDHATGDISFYEDTGTTAKFFWDASAESLGIGTSSPVAPLHVKGDTARFENSAGSYFVGISYDASGSLISQLNSTGHLTLSGGSGTGTLRFNTASSEAMRIDSSGRVMIGTTSSSSLFTVQSTGTSTAHIKTTATNGFAQMRFENDAKAYSIGVGSNDQLYFYDNTSSTNRILIDSSGNVGIGTSSPDTELHVEADTPVFRLTNPQSTSSLGLSMGKIEWETRDSSASGVIAHIDVVDSNNFGTTFDMVFATGQSGSATERMRIDSSGNVGIGTSSPSSYHANANNLVIQDSGNAGITIATTDSAYFSQVNFADGTSGAQAYTGILRYAHSDNSLRIIVNTGEKMRIDSSGNLLVGKTVNDNSTVGTRFQSDGFASLVRDGDASLLLRRNTSDGTILRFNKAGTDVGSIGVYSTGTRIYLGTGDTGLVFGHDVGSGDAIFPMNPSTNLARDNAIDLGVSGARFDDIHATNGTIQTSDRNEKQDIAELTDAEQRVAVAAKGLLRKFRWKDAVAEKGDEARTHFGIIAQDLQAAFAAEGLDAGDYAMFIHSTWTDEETGEERSRMGVRYSELLAFIIAAI